MTKYGYPKTNRIVQTFRPHGSKYWHQLHPHQLPDFAPDDPDFWQIHKENFKIIMHDQEPIFLDHLVTYRFMVCNQKKLLPSQDHIQEWAIEYFAQKSEQSLNDIDWLAQCIAGEKKPIICHSEMNSDDVAILVSKGWIPCYYWWHGIIARDWFRQYQLWPNLEPRDKSQNHQKFLLYARATDGSRNYRRTLINHCRQYQAITDYNWSGRDISSDSSAIIIPDDADAPIHLVAETLFDTNKVYLTEKVFKPMVMSQAFIVFGAPGTLAYLRNYGFKTFGECWNENYDLVTNADHRMAMLKKLIDDLATMPADQFKEVYQRALPIIEHNHKRFYEVAFQDDLILEMHTNMKQALLEQNQRH